MNVSLMIPRTLHPALAHWEKKTLDHLHEKAAMEVIENIVTMSQPFTFDLDLKPRKERHTL